MNLRQKKILTFIIGVLGLFLWGVANQMIGPMSRVFSNLFDEGPELAVTFSYVICLSYVLMALPAGILCRNLGYRSCLLCGLGLYAAGSFSFLPASQLGAEWLVMLAHIIMWCGISCIQVATCACAITVGDRSLSAFRICMAMCCSSFGWFVGYHISSDMFHDGTLNLELTMASNGLDSTEDIFVEMARQRALSTLTMPYVWVGLAATVLAVLLSVLELRESRLAMQNSTVGVGMQTYRRNRPLGAVLVDLLHNRKYMFGLSTQFLYTAGQTMCWSTILSYGAEVMISNEGYSRVMAETEAQNFLMISMVIFVSFRFVAAILLRLAARLRASRMLIGGAAASALLVALSIVTSNTVGIWCLVATAACMSSMLPNIYYLTLENLDHDTVKIGTSGLALAMLSSILVSLLNLTSEGSMVKQIFMVCIFAVIWFFAAYCLRDQDKKKNEYRPYRPRERK